MSCDQSAASSEMGAFEDGALFSNDITVLYGSNESRSSICADCAETAGTGHLQNYRVGNATDPQILIDPMLSRTSGLQGHPCQSSGCAISQSLNASQCRGVIFWLPCASGAEVLEAVLQGRSAGCSEHVQGNNTSCLPEDTSACLQCPRDLVLEHADQNFQAAKPCHGHDQCPAPSDGTLNPSMLSVCAETINISRPPFKCDYPACKQYFKRQRNLDRHRKQHLGERLHVCWVPGCQRSFSRSDNLKAHYATHGTHGGRNRYVATLDKTNAIYDPRFCGQLTAQGWPLGGGGYERWH